MSVRLIGHGVLGQSMSIGLSVDHRSLFGHLFVRRRDVGENRLSRISLASCWLNQRALLPGPMKLSIDLNVG
jgi:hypothetical protein